MVCTRGLKSSNKLQHFMYSRSSVMRVSKEGFVRAMGKGELELFAGEEREDECAAEFARRALF
jgi:hypothetical protein